MLCRLAELAGGAGREVSLVPRARRSLLVLRLDDAAAEPSSIHPPAAASADPDEKTSASATSPPANLTPARVNPAPPPPRDTTPATSRREGEAQGVIVGCDSGTTAAARGVVAYINRCPHVGLPLNLFPDRFLTADRELIICSAHGATFQKHDGRCVGGPCAGTRLSPVAIELARCSSYPAGPNAYLTATGVGGPGSAGDTHGTPEVAGAARRVGTDDTAATAGSAAGGDGHSHGAEDDEWCVVLPARVERSFPPELLAELTTSRPAIPPRRKRK